MLKTIYFDLGNVLCFFSRAQMVDQIARCCGLSEGQVEGLLLENQGLQEAYEKGEISSEGVYRAFCKISPKRFSFREWLDAFTDIFTPNEALWLVVERLKQEGMQLILISNTSEGHYNYVYSHYPILRLFDHKVLSFEVGRLKPDAHIFHKALALAACAPSECFYTDDIPAFVEGAKKAGLEAALYTDVPTLCNHLIQRGCQFLVE